MINKFISYSKNYPSIIELDRNVDKDIFEDLYKIIENASLIFKLNNEDFYYIIDGIQISTNIEYLIKLNNQIDILPENDINENE